MKRREPRVRLSPLPAAFTEQRPKPAGSSQFRSTSVLYHRPRSSPGHRTVDSWLKRSVSRRCNVSRANMHGGRWNQMCDNPGSSFREKLVNEIERAAAHMEEREQDMKEVYSTSVSPILVSQEMGQESVNTEDTLMESLDLCSQRTGPQEEEQEDEEELKESEEIAEERRMREAEKLQEMEERKQAALLREELKRQEAVAAARADEERRLVSQAKAKIRERQNQAVDQIMHLMQEIVDQDPILRHAEEIHR